MKTLESPRNKLIIAGALLTVLVLAVTLQSSSPSNIARAVLAVAAVAGIGWWFLNARARPRFTMDQPRLAVVQRIGLSQRTGVALVEVDGNSYLIVHGDGFARIQRAGSRKPELVDAGGAQ